VAIRVPLLNIPFERDEGEYAYIAWRIGHHELPYRDWVDQKPPGIFWVYRLALSLPFEPIRAVHLMGLVFSAASACALFFLASRFMKRFWATIAAVLFAILSADPLAEGTTANTELFMLLPLILSQIALLSAVSENVRRIPLALSAGALTGIAVAFKQVAIVNWPLLLFSCWLFAAGAGRLRKTLHFTAWSAVGAAAIWGFIGSYFMLRHGLKDFIYNVFTHNLEYIKTIPWSVRLEYCIETLKTLSHSQLLIWFFSALGLAMLCISKKTKIFLFLTASMVASLVGVSMSGYFFSHYFQQLLPVLCLTAVFGAVELEGASFWKAVPARSRRAILGLALFILPVIAVYPFIFTYSPKEAVRKIYPGNSVFAEMPDIGRRLAQITRPEDRVFIFGAEPEVFFYARRVSATRYIFLFPLYGPYSDAKARQMETSDEVSANQPAAALLLPNGLFYSPDSEQYFTKWTQTYLHDNFHVDTYLMIDQSDVVHLVPNTSNQALPAPDGQRITGILFVRNSK
jgi:Dolichyl-phosphate-mannose-protein mannosyltransferase